MPTNKKVKPQSIMGLINKMPTDVQIISSIPIGCIFLWLSIVCNGLYIFSAVYCTLLKLKRLSNSNPALETLLALTRRA